MMSFENVRRQFFLRSNEMLRITPGLIISGAVGLLVVVYTSLFKGAFRIYESIFHAHPDLIFILMPAMFLLSWFFMYFFAPGSSGSGIPQVMATLSSHKVLQRQPPLLGLRVLVFKIISSIVAIFGGAAIGPEGPCVHIGAALFYFCQKRMARFPALRNYNLNPEMAILTGAAAGLAAAFNTPLGGIVFAIEDLSSRHVREFETQTIMGIVASGLVAQGLLGTYLYFGYLRLDPVTTPILVWCIPLAFVCGIAGAYFGKLLYWGISKRKHMSLSSMAMFSVFAGLIVAAVQLFTHAAAGSGVEMIEEAMRTGHPVGTMAMLARFFMPVISFTTVGAGGLLAPALSCGGTIGVWLSHILNLPGGTATFGLVGMISFLTGMTRAPLTAFVLVFEMTDARTMAIPMMLTALTAYAASRMVGGESYYELMKKFFMDEPGEHDGTLTNQ